MYCNTHDTLEEKPWKWNVVNSKPVKLDKILIWRNFHNLTLFNLCSYAHLCVGTSCVCAHIYVCTLYFQKQLVKLDLSIRIYILETLRHKRCKKAVMIPEGNLIITRNLSIWKLEMGPFVTLETAGYIPTRHLQTSNTSWAVVSCLLSHGALYQHPASHHSTGDALCWHSSPLCVDVTTSVSHHWMGKEHKLPNTYHLFKLSLF